MQCQTQAVSIAKSFSIETFFCFYTTFSLQSKIHAVHGGSALQKKPLEQKLENPERVETREKMCEIFWSGEMSAVPQ